MLAALVAVYIVLGILYESYIHPITILSTLPSAGIGALLALKLAGVEFSIIAMIGVLLLIGIVKKNAIMMIDVALERERNEGLDPRDAIYEACLLRFRPILMTTMAAMLGALPLALGFGEGAELRRPLGISIIGGLIVSQILTLYTTPVIYLYLDRFRRRDRDRPSRIARAMGGGAGVAGMRRIAASCFASCPLAGCLVGPDYQRPPPASPPTAEFKEPAESIFRPAMPRDAIDRGPWWQIYGDPTLDRLAAQVDISNQTLKASEAAYRQARALVRQDQSGLYPSITGTGSDAADRHRHARGGGAVITTTNQSGNVTSSVEPVFGRRRAHLGDRRLGQHPPHDRERFGGGPGQRRRPRGGAAVGAGRRRHQLFLAAHLRPAHQALPGDRGGLRARRCRSCRTRSMPASSRGSTSTQAQTLYEQTRVAAGGRGHQPRPVRACDRRADRQGAVRVQPGARRRRRRTCRRSTPASRRRCWSGGPTSPRPSARWRRPTPRSAWRRRPTIRTSRWAAPSPS